MCKLRSLICIVVFEGSALHVLLAQHTLIFFIVVGKAGLRSFACIYQSFIKVLESLWVIETIVLGGEIWHGLSLSIFFWFIIMSKYHFSVWIWLIFHICVQHRALAGVFLQVKRSNECIFLFENVLKLLFLFFKLIFMCLLIVAGGLVVLIWTLIGFVNELMIWKCLESLGTWKLCFLRLGLMQHRLQCCSM